jgi:hypothetical protein
VGLLIKIVQAAAVPQPALDNELRTTMIDGQRIGGVGLQLDRIRTGRFGCIHQRDRPPEIPVVVSGQFRNHVRRMAPADLPSGDGDISNHDGLQRKLVSLSCA